MKSKIIEYLRSHPQSPAGTIALGITEKRSSVSKCLTRMARTGEVNWRKRGGRVLYDVPAPVAPTPSPAPQSANA